MPLNDRVGRLLPCLDEALPVDLVDVLATFLRAEAGARTVGLHLVDYDLRTLRAIEPGGRMVAGAPEPLVGSHAGRSYATQSAIVVPHDGDVEIFVPVTLRAERLGVLVVTLPDPVDADVLEGLKGVATTLAYVLQAAGRYTDLFELARRSEPLRLAAEMQWAMQPVRAFSCDLFSLAGQLLPAYEVGGDNYDWVVNRDTVSLAALDAMGHGVNASMLGALGVTALRNARRMGQGVGDRAQTADRAIYRQFGGAQFVTAFCMDVDIHASTALAVMAGHPAPFRLRDGHVELLDLPPELPLGLLEMTTYHEVPVELRDGDRLMIVSDGVLDATATGTRDVFFGSDRLEALLLATSSEPPHEAVRHTVDTLLEFQQDEMRDDATVVVFDWHRP